MFVREVKSRIIKNSRGERTIEILLKTYEGKFISSAPSGKSRGKGEIEPWNKKGIVASLARLRAFQKKLTHQNFLIKKIRDLKKLEDMIHSFEHKYGRLGGNVMYALETVFLKAAAVDNKKELFEFINDDVNSGKKMKVPMPVGNCIGGGKHSTQINGKKPDIQEFLLIPNASSFRHAVTLNLRAYEMARRLLKTKEKNDENAWMTDKSNEEVLEILKTVSKKYNLRIGLDVAASSFYEKGYYKYKNKELIRDKVDQSDYISKIAKKFGIFYLEDPMEEEDFSGYKQVLNTIHEKRKTTMVVGDDLTTTHKKAVERAIRSKSMNAMIIKPNQVGSIIEMAQVVKLCKKHKIRMIFSHRSGETMDDAIADYCVGFGGDFLKSGIFGRERLIKLKRVMDIERKIK